MHKYKWDLNEIRNNIIILDNIKKNISDEYVLEVISEIITVYSNMLKIYSKKTFKTFDDEIIGDNSLEEIIFDTASFYEEKNLPILDAVLNSYYTLKDSNVNVDVEVPYIKNNNDDIVEFTEDFIKKMTTPKIYDKYKEIMSNHTMLNIKYLKENNNYAGVTLFDSILNKRYISVNRNNTLLDLIILPHEMFHNIFNDDNDETLNSYNCYYLTEVEGCLANILFAEYYKNNYSFYENFFYDYYNAVLRTEIDQLVIRNSLLDAAKTSKKIRLNKLNKHLSLYEIPQFSKEKELARYVSIPQDINIKYSISQLAAIDLFYIYKEDKELAFYLLKNIRYFKHEDDIMSLLRRNHITFMDDEYTNLKKYLKK